MNRPCLQLVRVGRDFFVPQPGGRPARLVAVDQISFTVREGETFGLVGESGCGKSTLGKLICRLEDAGRGEIFFRGKSLRELRGEDLRRERHHFQYVFQDAAGSLNPRRTVEETVRESLVLRKRPGTRSELESSLSRVGLGAELLSRYPHQLSGGQRQRLNLARALAQDPGLLVADEPVSSLDVSIQAQILNLFLELQDSSRRALVFISHDLRVVGHVADRIGVMYLGRLMELAPAGELLAAPLHPYTHALLAALPKLEPGRGRVRSGLQGEQPSPIEPSAGCRFFSRCPYGRPACRDYENVLLPAGEGRETACCRWREISLPQGPIHPGRG